MNGNRVVNSQLSFVETNLGSMVASEIFRATAAESGLSAQISSVETNLETSLAAEVARATAAEADLSSHISSVETNLETSIAAEVTRATDAETALGAQISSVETNLETSLNLKADKAGATFSGDVTLDSYLQFGALWRVKGSADGKRLVFEYKRNDVWRTALPFITSA